MKFTKGFVFLAMFALLGVSCVTAPPQAEDQAQGLDKEEIRKAIRDHIVPIRHCYEKELKTNPSLSGKLVLEWDVEGLGKVTRVKVNKPFHPAVDECVASVIKGTLFPTPAKGTIGRVSYPFVFNAK